MTRTFPARSHLTDAEMAGPVAETADLLAELRADIQGEVRFDAYSRMLYSTDASLYQIQPVGVVLPKNADDIQAAMQIAARHAIPVLPRGGGSSLAGQAVGAALVLDTSKYMDRILGVDEERRTVRVQPGMTVGILNKALAPLGLMLGPDPASAERATVGGSIGNNATGSHSILYGMMADNVQETAVVLADGSTARFGPVAPGDLAALGRGDSLESRIYRELPGLISGVTEQIVARWPKHWRRASGYNLDRLAAALLPADQRSRLNPSSPFRPDVVDPVRIDRFNLAQLITGSEGTLATITEATLGLVPKPKFTGLAVVHFDRVVDACASIPIILETDPSASELLDKQLMDLARAQPEWAKKMFFVEGDPEAVLLTEYYGNSPDEVEKKLAHLEDHLRRRGVTGVIRRYVQPQAQADVWSVRKAGLNILMGKRGEYKPITGIEDVSVPPEVLAAYVERILAFAKTQTASKGVAVYAHASAGCLHVRPLLNTKSADGIAALQALGEFACDLAVEYGGTMSGEHGDGLVRSALNPRLFGPELYEALRQTKAIFDPENRMNPGKIVDAPPIGENLRYGTEYQTIELKTVYDWSSDGGFGPAVEMCNGAGVCRKLGAGTMCPSFQATREEQDSTRGRANSLRNALAGRIPREELYTPEMYGVMDLCLGCKACKSECPSSVDMARIKSEYLVHYYAEHGLPLFNRMMGLLPSINRLLYGVARPLVPLVNATLASAPAKAVLARIGVHPARSLPPYAPNTFSHWFHARGEGRGAKNATRDSQAATRNSVILFHDTWAEYNHPEVAQAAVRVLEAAGYAVYLAEGRACCGRPLITGGQADKAKAWVDQNVALLAPYAAQGIPIVGVEPSCILTLRDEYPALAADKNRAQILAQHALTFEEFVVREAEAGGFGDIWQETPGQVHLHGHCHARALVGDEASVAALKQAGYRVQVIPSGCCGMAGDFGYEKDHYEISRNIGEDRLFPAVRAAAKDDLIIASGTSCRDQIGHFTERKPVHIAQALEKALKG
ncbi:MAG: FAD-linked oxidase C-terminal domain-containing protein [Caldilineaceae bacterium]